MSNQIQILVAVEHTVERKGLSSLLNSQPSLVVIGEAANRRELLLMAHESRPDIILITKKLFHQEELDLPWQSSVDSAVLVLCNSREKAATSDNGSGKLCFIYENAGPEELKRVIQEVVSR